MSWIVQRILMDTSSIREENDIDSDRYNDLIIIEKKLNEMRNNNMLSPVEKDIISLIQRGYLFGDMESKLLLGRDTISRMFKNVCERVAYSLGGEFTDEGFVKDVAERHNLSDDELIILERFMDSNLKHKILRRPLGTTNEKNIFEDK